MSLHDEYARMTPFEIAFPEEAALEKLVEDVRGEAAGRRVDPSSPGIFFTLGSVTAFVRRLQGPDASEGTLMQYGALVFHAVHFLRAGRPLYLAETAVTRRLVDAAPAAAPRPPSTAGYLQLPQHLFWIHGSKEGAPESMDGLFWVASEAGALHVLPISGVLPERAGFRALPLPEAPLAEAADWLEADMRSGAADYQSELPGHDLDRLYSVETAGELLKLLARFFAYMECTPAAVAVTPAASVQNASETPEPGKGPRPSELAYSRVRLVA